MITIHYYCSSVKNSRKSSAKVLLGKSVLNDGSLQYHFLKILFNFSPQIANQSLDLYISSSFVTTVLRDFGTGRLLC